MYRHLTKYNKLRKITSLNRKHTLLKQSRATITDGEYVYFNFEVML